MCRDKKHFPVPYAWKKLLAYIVISCILYGIHQLFRNFSPSILLNHAFGLLEMAGFIVFRARVEKSEFDKILLSIRKKN